MLNSPSGRPTLELPCKVVFLHIAKTAGTSIVQFFRDRMPADLVTSHGDFMNFSGTKEERTNQLKQFQFLSGHFGYSDVASLLEDAYSFTFLRDPVDRVLSLYKFLQWPASVKTIPAARIAKELGVAGFLTSTRPEVNELLDNQQTWQLARCYWQEDREALRHLNGDELLNMAIENLGKFDLVGCTETFDADFRRVLDHLGINEPVPEERDNRTMTPVDRDELAPSVLASLQERMALDHTLFNYVREKRLSGESV